MTAENNQFAVETFSLTKIFCDWWGRNRVVAVDNLNLRVRRNEVFGLLGPNGSGKTTILKMLLGLLHPTKGKAIVLGGDVRNPKISAKVGFLPEESYLYPYLNARETLDFYGRLFGLNSRVRSSRIDALLEMVGLSAMANRPIGTFSKGMARRIGLAQALINDPQLLILDEPTSGLDPIGTRQIKDLIVELARRGKTVLMCSHLLADAEEVCDNVAILYGGIVQREGSISDLLERRDKTQIITDALNERMIEQIKRIVGKEASQFEVKSPMQGLESYFVDIIKQAQQAKRPTSGAMNRIDITEAERVAAVSNVLDKLVAAKVDSDKSQEQQTPVETIKIERDETVLDKLIEQDKQIETEPVVRSEQPEEAKKEIKKDLLDKLVDKKEGDKENG